jgi:hypothetical protein
MQAEEVYSRRDAPFCRAASSMWVLISVLSWTITALLVSMNPIPPMLAARW